ncbi:MAG: ORF6N domain-containing protein, partial [Chitinivibrionia bacterium]|nr:ORF6N domain-containing protein [Chitinivibrionia bacterium]
CQIVKTAQKSIILIDNYVNEATLTIFSKRAENVKVMLFTKEISMQLKLDIEKFNKQYPPIEAKEFDLSHDRFLIVDDKEVYHWGASLKDSGKKWFAFSKMDLDGLLVLEKIRKWKS